VLISDGLRYLALILLHNVGQEVRRTRQWWEVLRILTATWSYSFGIDEVKHRFVEVFVEAHPRLHLLK
jgi:hypothetical protein